MADIKIYGTLYNDTAEPIAYADQVKDTVQGKTQEAINSELLTKVSGLSNVYQYKGSKGTIAEVQALTDAAVGDVYNVVEAFTLDSKTYPAGTNVAKTDDGWDALGGSYSAVVGASASAAGTAGLVPAPAKGAQSQVLTGAGTFQAVSHTLSTSTTSATAALKVGSTSVSSMTIPVATTTAGGLMSAADKTKLNGIATGAEVNQNAIGKVVVGSTTITAAAEQDTLTLVAGSNVTLTPDATNKKVTVAATNTTYSTFTGATSTAAGAAGLVPAPAKGYANAVLTGAGDFKSISIVQDTTYSSALKRTFNLKLGDTNVSTLVINGASSEMAGFMTSTDKANLDAVVEAMTFA